MSLGSIVLCPPCLSLSLLFCLDLCLSSEHCRVTRLPLALASGTRVQRRRSLQEGGALLDLSIFSKVSPRGRGAPSVIYFSEVLSAMRAGGGTERAASFGWRAPCPGHTHLGSSARRTSPGLRQDQRGPGRRRQTFFLRGQSMSRIPVAGRGRLPVL